MENIPNQDFSPKDHDVEGNGDLDETEKSTKPVLPEGSAINPGNEPEKGEDGKDTLDEGMYKTRDGIKYDAMASAGGIRLFASWSVDVNRGGGYWIMVEGISLDKDKVIPQVYVGTNTEEVIRIFHIVVDEAKISKDAHHVRELLGIFRKDNR